VPPDRPPLQPPERPRPERPPRPPFWRRVLLWAILAMISWIVGFALGWLGREIERGWLLGGGAR
jgi:hypothetical protein